MSTSPKISACLSNGCKTLTVNDSTGVYSLINLYGWGYPNEVKTDVLSATLQVLAPGQTTYTTIDVTSAVTTSSPFVQEFPLTEIAYSDLVLPVSFTDGIYEFIYTVSGINTYAPSPPADTGQMTVTNIIQACNGVTPGNLDIIFDLTNNAGATFDAVTYVLPGGNMITKQVPGTIVGATVIGETLTIPAGTYVPGVAVEIHYQCLDVGFSEITEGYFYFTPISCGVNDLTFEYVYKTTKVFVCNARCCIDKQIASLTDSFNPNCGCCENREKVKDLQLADMLLSSIELGGDCMDADKLASHLVVLAKICLGKNCCN